MKTKTNSLKQMEACEGKTTPGSFTDEVANLR